MQIGQAAADPEPIAVIRTLLGNNPRGLSISEIVEETGIHRNTVAKYLDILRLRGDAELKKIGTAKNYFIARRIPESVFPLFCEDPYLLVSRRGKVTFADDKVPEITGIELCDLTGMNAEEIILTIMPAEEACADIHRAIRGEKVLKRVVWRRGGGRRHLVVTMVPAVDDRGLESAGIILTDETPSVHAAEEAELAWMRYAALAEDQREFILHARPDWTLTYVSPSFCLHLGKGRDDLVGYRYSPLTGPEEKENLEQAVRSLSVEHSAFTLRYSVVMPDGKVRMEEWTMRGIFNENGYLEELHGLGRDITELIRLEEQIHNYQAGMEEMITQRTREMQAANRSLVREIEKRKTIENELIFISFAFDNASDSIILFNREGRVYRANKTAYRLLGYSRNEMEGLSVTRINPEISPEVWEEMWQGAGNEGSERALSVHAKKDGSLINVELSRSFVRFGDLSYFCSAAREISVLSEDPMPSGPQ